MAAPLTSVAAVNKQMNQKIAATRFRAKRDGWSAKRTADTINLVMRQHATVRKNVAAQVAARNKQLVAERDAARHEAATPAPVVQEPAPDPNFGNTTNPSVVVRLKMIRETYEKLGLGDLWDEYILPAVVRDPSLSSSEILASGELQQTKAYKTRFKANEARVANGKNALSPLDYIQLEETYKQAMSQAGLPKGFYDDPSDFQNWIGNDVAPAEVQGRVAMAADAYTMLAENDPGTLKSLQDWYGIERDGVMAYFLDGDKAVSLLEKQKIQRQARLGGAAARHDVTVDASTANFMDSQGVQETDQRFQQVGQETDAATRLGGLYQDGFGQKELVDEAFGTSGAVDANRKRKKLVSTEKAAFSGSSAVSQQSLAQRKQAL